MVAQIEPTLLQKLFFPKRLDGTGFVFPQKGCDGFNFVTFW